jgi:hypothetical protein
MQLKLFTTIIAKLFFYGLLFLILLLSLNAKSQSILQSFSYNTKQYTQNRTYTDTTHSGFDLEYYEKELKSAKKYFRTGSILAVSGIAVGTTGAILYANTASSYAYGEVLLFFAGIQLFNIGIPFAITGLVRMNKTKKVINAYYDSQTISIQITNDGVGLVLKL